MEEKDIQKFIELYGEDGEIRSYASPGRVNLIGEHTDYNGGHVFPCALTLGTFGIARRRTDQRVRFYSENFADLGVIQTSVKDLDPNTCVSWTAYPKGVLWAFQEQGYALPYGFDLLVGGDIPSGAGLSSSASLEVLTGVIARDLYGWTDVSMLTIARLCQYAENHFNGVNCGIMDQFACAMGKKDHALFLDTQTLDYQYIPMQLADYRLILTNSQVKHELADSAYNDRRVECELALKALQKEIDIQTLGDLSEADFEAHKAAIHDPVLTRRARHAVYENQRTMQAVSALKKQDLSRFGQLMNASHQSLKVDYEVSCPEIDLLVEAAQSLDGVLGSRITGGGFGGCTVSLVRTEAVPAFIDTVGTTYEQRIGHPAAFYVADIGDGARRIS